MVTVTVQGVYSDGYSSGCGTETGTVVVVVLRPVQWVFGVLQ